MYFKIISILPNSFKSYLSESIIGKAIEKKLIKFSSYDLRNWTKDKHKSVDDAPYGGGAGMLLKVEPIYRAIKQLSRNKKNKKIVLLSASGKTWNQKLAKKYSKLDELILVCGRYEGVDARIKEFIDEEISIGNYIISGGELAALIIIDSVSRLIPGVLGNKESLIEESFSMENSKILEYPQYTRPANFKVNRKNYKVPDVLLSGNHKKIDLWRKKNRKNKESIL